MPTDTVIMGATYKHDESDVTMKCYAASVPELDDSVKLCAPEHWSKWTGFMSVWQGTWENFCATWTEIKLTRTSNQETAT